jgi:hypothetical protein
VDASALANSAAEALVDRHTLKARGYLVAARAAHLDVRYTEALDLYAALKRHAVSANEKNEAVWGTVGASLVLESPGLEVAFKELESLPDKRLTDRVRLEGARLNLARILGTQPNTREGSRLATQVADPWVRSAWSNLHGYALLLGARYDEAAVVLRSALADLNEIGISFATHHLEWMA